MKDWIIGWLSEKTTWAGIITLATAFGMPELTDAQQAGLTALGASFFAMPDRK